MIRTSIFSLLLATSLAATAQLPQTNTAPTTALNDPRTVKKYMNNLSYAFDPCVFTAKEFPAGSIQPAAAQGVLGSIQVAVTFYNEKFEEVKTANTPGRFGAVVRITLGDGTKLVRFISLYRLPEGAASRTINLGKVKVPLETGMDPAAAKRRNEEIGIAMKSGAANETGGAGFAMLLGLAKAMPGITPDQLLGDLMGFMAQDDVWWYALKKKIGLQPSYLYFTQLPEGYESATTKRWPLVLFLHGSGAIGTTPEQLKVTGVPHGLLGRKLPVIFVVPACPDRGWSAPALAQLLDEVSAKYRVDPDRIIVTGASMGGFGTWALGGAYPERFSAIVPVCGGGNPNDGAKLSKLPVWAFHGQRDTTVPVMMSQMMAAAIQKAGGTPHLTIYPEAAHNAWDQAYATEALYTWMLAQQRGKPEVKTSGVQGP